MVHLCPTKSLCIETPFANLSAEAPDVDLFLGSNFGWDLNVPRLGWNFTDTDTPAWCRGTTQEAADQCAGNQQLTGQLGTWSNNGKPIPTFFNQQVQCPFTCPDGLQFVWTVLPGVFQAMDQDTANSIALSNACANALRFWICMGTLNPNATVGVTYSSTVVFTGGRPPISAVLFSGSLPPGLFMSQAVDGRSFTLSGTPTTAGTFNFTVRAIDANGNFMQKSYTVTVAGPTCAFVFANPAWFNYQSGAAASGFSASGPNFSLFGTGEAGTNSRQHVLFGGSTSCSPPSGSPIPYTPGNALSCNLTITMAKVGFATSAIDLTVDIQGGGQVQLLNAAIPVGTTVFPFTIPANCTAISFCVNFLCGDTVQHSTINITGAFSS